MSEQGERAGSHCFTGRVGQAVPPERFPPENLIINPAQWNSEGNWAFCVFPENDEVYAARFGFQRGSFDFTDFGGKPVENYLQLHVELLTKDGAVLWLPYGRFRAEQAITNAEIMDVRMAIDGRELFSLCGWPQQSWRFRSDDGEIGVDLKFDLFGAALLPDCLLPHNVFAMWAAAGRCAGRVWYGQRSWTVKGTVFHDHPRVKVQNNAVARRQWYIYTPLVFQDGSVLFSYYTEDEKKRRIDSYCFGLLFEPDGRAHWLPDAELLDLKFDADDLPVRWRLRWPKGLILEEAEVSVRPTTILKSWGAPGAPQTRRDFVYIPLVLEGRGRRRSVEGKVVFLTAHGLAEYWRPPKTEKEN